MTDSPKPITPEFVRGVQWAIDAVASADDDDLLDEFCRQRVARFLRKNQPWPDPLAAAKERLGAWLVEDHFRGWGFRRTVELAEFFVWVTQSKRVVGKGEWLPTLAEAINAALDAAERGE